jgi:SAM-dependent methyltransferase
MDQFSNGYQSHEHSLEVLGLIERFNDFMDSITSIADMGCGEGLDVNWWARKEYIETTEDAQGNIHETLRPHNYRVYAVDKNIAQIDKESLPDTVNYIQGDFEKPLLSRPVDFMWCHNSFQYATNPLNTLKIWNEQMVENGMLYIGMPVQSSYKHNRLVTRGNNYCYFNHNFLSLIYMLAVNGFDCRDAYFLKRKENPWLHAAVYKSQHAPMNPAETSWYHLAEKNLINDSMKNSLTKYGYIKQEDVIYAWLDRDFHYIQD